MFTQAGIYSFWLLFLVSGLPGTVQRLWQHCCQRNPILFHSVSSVGTLKGEYFTFDFLSIFAPYEYHMDLGDEFCVAKT